MRLKDYAISPLQPSLMILSSVSCSFILASAGMWKLILQTLVYKLMQRLAEDVGLPNLLRVLLKALSSILQVLGLARAHHRSDSVVMSALSMCTDGDALSLTRTCRPAS